MEGLIPLVYKTLKKNKTRRQYECLSSGAAQNYKISDLYVHGQSGRESHHVYMKTSRADQKNIGGWNPGHRRHMSMGVDGMISDGHGASPSPTTSIPKLKRFRSHRMFSCVTGA